MTLELLEGKSFRWLFNAAADGMIVVSSEGIILAANPSAERLFGYSEASLIGHRIEILVPERYRTRHRVDRADYLAHPSTRPMGRGMALFARRQDESEFPVDISLAPLQAGGQDIVLATIQDTSRARDLAEHLRAQAMQLKENEARLRAVFETAVEGVIVIDERATIHQFNPGAERIFQYAADEVVGKNVRMLMPSPYREEHDGYVARYLDTGEPHVIGTGREVEGLRKDGTTFPLELTVGATQEGRRMFVGIVRDITARREVEQAQNQLLRELEAANEELKNFAYIVSHDLKAPLRGIGSLADWIATDNADQLDEEGKEHLSLLIARVKRMDALIDGILEYSRVGRVRETLVAIDLDSLLAEVIDSLAPPSGVQIEVAHPLPEVIAEPTRIRQVFQNLLGNAVKHLQRPDGEISLTYAQDADFWQFSVADNGPGIDKRHFDRIFHLFQTLTPKDRNDSTGVGLAVVKKIIEMYGGRIWVESDIGRGSTFHFTIPRAPTRSSPERSR